VTLTPLEAAVITREDYMADLLVDYGARVDDANAPTLQCLAKAVGAEAITAYVRTLSKEADCGGVALPWKP
jgi:hypothetical protein